MEKQGNTAGNRQSLVVCFSLEVFGHSQRILFCGVLPKQLRRRYFFSSGRFSCNQCLLGIYVSATVGINILCYKTLVAFTLSSISGELTSLKIQALLWLYQKISHLVARAKCCVAGAKKLQSPYEKRGAGRKRHVCGMGWFVRAGQGCVP